MSPSSESPEQIPAADTASKMSQHALPLPRYTTPTWEVELLISGVAVFAMLQLPGWLDEQLFALLPRFNATWRELVVLMHIYLKSAALILGVTFVLHLLLRAYWIALVGMSSVYPDGVRWERLKIGPIELDLSKKQTPHLLIAIERADNRSTTVFAIGVSLAIIIMFIAASILVGYVVLATVVTLVDRPIGGSFLLLLVMFVVLPYVLTHILDRMLGHRIAVHGRLAAAMRLVYRGYTAIGMGRGSNAAMALISSHSGERRTTVLISVLMFITIAVAVIGSNLARNPEAAGNYARFPFAEADDGQQVNRNHYADQRDADTAAILPYIQSDLPGDNFLRLLIPYDPVNDDAAMQRTCPESAAQPRVDRLACLASLHPLWLDGTAIQVAFETSSDPMNQLPALLAMIDIRNLPAGRHELQVGRPPAAKRKRNNDLDGGGSDATATDNKRPPFRIPFWR